MPRAPPWRRSAHPRPCSWSAACPWPRRRSGRARSPRRHRSRPACRPSCRRPRPARRQCARRGRRGRRRPPRSRRARAPRR
ncbi:MAG: hypothetical protein GEU88_02415 [Solirubrobacterales bacterium]|nr:hypothetical protein [Solirubrobacterales bacterium]